MSTQPIDLFASTTHVYFVGIGGIGMSALARYFHQIGKQVSGYDKTSTKLTRALAQEGILVKHQDVLDIELDLKPENTLVIYTPAIKKLAILSHLQSQGFEILKRAQVLGKITQNTQCIAIAGTHGKTTTSSLVAHLCQVANLPFSGFLGGIAENYQSNFIYNGNQYTVVEADEYDRSFLNLSPYMAGITSTDADHLDIYGDVASIEAGFDEFANLVPEDQNLLVSQSANIKRNHQSYSAKTKADFYSDNIRLEGDLVAFDYHEGELKVPFAWAIPGLHNVENATLAIALLRLLKVDFELIQAGLASFKGIKRRYTKHNLGDVVYIDDYAHHPTELDAVLDSIRAFHPNKKVLMVFQPHLFSRTKDFAQGFAQSFAKADELILLDIYPAREQPMPGVDAPWLASLCHLPEDKKQVSTLATAMDKIKNANFDILLTAGAGDIDTLYDGILAHYGPLSSPI
jgi:UDP-N-acetylmuramate--alanine ligase